MIGLQKLSLKTNYLLDSSISSGSSTETDFHDDDCKHYNDDSLIGEESANYIANEEH